VANGEADVTDIQAAIWAFEQSQGSDVNSRDILRDLLGELGLELPVTVSDLSRMAEDIFLAREALSRLEMAPEIPAGARGLWGAPGESFAESTIGQALLASGWVREGEIDEARAALSELESQFTGYVGAYFGEQAGVPGTRTLEVVNALLRPPMPAIDELPTAQEFSDQWRNAFAAYKTGFKGASQAAIALGTMESQLYEEYLADMMKYTKFGVSPFYLQEVERLLQPGAGAGEREAYAARGRARGVGPPDLAREQFVTQITPGGPGLPRGGKPTEQEFIRTAGGQAAEWAAEWGPGVPREFIARPRIDPGQWLASKYPEERLQLLAATPTRGGGAAARERVGGAVSAPRRLRG